MLMLAPPGRSASRSRPDRPRRRWLNRPGFRGVQLYNQPLYEPYDHIHRQTSLNNIQAHTSHDGQDTIVMAASDPGVRNWLDIGHRPRGQFIIRHIGGTE